MRSIAAAVVASAALGAAAEAQIRRLPPADAPALAAARLDGGRFDLDARRGRVVLVNFWATWCEPCREEMPSLERLAARLAGAPFEVVAVNYGEGNERIEQFLRQQKLSVPVLLDPDKAAAKAWGAGGLPMTFLVDARGQLRYSTFGERDWSEGEALRLVQGLVGEARDAR